jgi:hypothetical protein
LPHTPAFAPPRQAADHGTNKASNNLMAEVDVANSSRLTSDEYPVEAFDRAVASFQCANENRVPCPEADNSSSWLQDMPENTKGPWMPCCVKQSFYEMLIFFHNVVYEHIDVSGKGFWYSLLDGTMLGSVRNGDIIDWDDDLDIVVPKAQFSWLHGVLQDAASKSPTPYFVTNGTWTPWDNVPLMRLHMSQASDRHIDIWAAENFDPDHPQACVVAGGTVLPTAVAFPLQKCTIQGSVFPCFADAYKYLDNMFGKYWKEPVPDNTKFKYGEVPTKAPLPAECQRLASRRDLHAGAAR